MNDPTTSSCRRTLFVAAHLVVDGLGHSCPHRRSVDHTCVLRSSWPHASHVRDQCNRHPLSLPNDRLRHQRVQRGALWRTDGRLACLMMVLLAGCREVVNRSLSLPTLLALTILKHLEGSE
jgi:hypothetical protein